MTGTCQVCGVVYEAKRPSSRFCSGACRQRHHRNPSLPRPADHPAGDSLSPGPIEQVVRADVEALMTRHPMGESLAEMSYMLARTLDRGAGSQAPVVNRELRSVLLALAEMRVPHDDLDDQLSTPTPGEDYDD